MIRKSFFLALAVVPLCSSAQFGFQRIDTIDVYEATVLQKYAWAGGMDYCQFSNIDLNYDGTEDLFVFDRTNEKVLTFIQTGAPGSVNYVYAPQYEPKFPEYDNVYDFYQDIESLFSWVLLVDYNCDGKKDIFASRSGGIKVFKNTGNSTDGLSFEQVSIHLKSLIYTTPNAVIPVSSVDLPGLVDVDGDSDIDIINFWQSDYSLAYYKNMSMETYGVCDSLIFEMKNTCWGRFTESSSSSAITLWDTLSTSPPDCQPVVSIPNPESWHPGTAEERHSGSSVLPLDLDNNGVMDVIIGDISTNNLVMLMNSGTAPNQNSGMESFDLAFPSNSIPVDVTVFPAAYHVDINNDGARDLVVTPSSTVGSENRAATWYYENTATDLAPVFQFQQDDFLQGDMIDVGSRSLPVYFDHNGDGLKDLLVSSAGHFDPVSGNQVCSIYYYENTGTPASPEFTLITQDYMGLSTLGIGYTLAFYPTFGDLDADGDEDMVLGEYSGYCYYFENTGGAGNAAIFNTYIMLDDYLGGPLVDPTTAGIFPCPVLVDLDRDNDLDIVLGRRNGHLNYYENIGTPAAYSFLYITNNLGSVNVCEWWSTEGYAVPQVLDVDGEYKLVIGSKNGYVHFYDQVEGNIAGNFHLADSSLDNIMIGTYSAPAIADLNNDNRFEMALGNERGGLVLYKSASIDDINVAEQNKRYDILVYPNPASTSVTIDLSGVVPYTSETLVITATDLSGRLVHTETVKDSRHVVAINEWAKGTYILQVTGTDRVITEKLVVN